MVSGKSWSIQLEKLIRWGPASGLHPELTLNLSIYIRSVFSSEFGLSNLPVAAHVMDISSSWKPIKRGKTCNWYRWFCSRVGSSVLHVYEGILCLASTVPNSQYKYPSSQDIWPKTLRQMLSRNILKNAVNNEECVTISSYQNNVFPSAAARPR